MTNFGACLINGEIYLAVLLTIIPAHLWTFPSVSLGKLTDAERAAMIVDLLLRVGLIERGELSPNDILHKREDINQLMFAKMFVYDAIAKMRKMRRLKAALSANQVGGSPDHLGALWEAYSNEPPPMDGNKMSMHSPKNRSPRTWSPSQAIA